MYSRTGGPVRPWRGVLPSLRSEAAMRRRPWLRADTVALVRARFPQLTAGEVMHRIVATAHAPGRGYDDQVGAGVIDPVAALTAELPNERQPQSESVSAYPLAPQPDPRPRRIALIGGTILAVAVACAYGLSLPKRRVRRLRPDEY